MSRNIQRKTNIPGQYKNFRKGSIANENIEENINGDPDTYQQIMFNIRKTLQGND